MVSGGWWIKPGMRLGAGRFRGSDTGELVVGLSMRRAWLALALLLSPVTLAGAAPKGASFDVPQLLARLGEFVAGYYARAQSIICEETVRLQPLSHDLSPDNSFPRRLLYDLRVSWEPSADGGTPEAQVLRSLVTVNGRAPRKNDRDGCLDPRSLSPEPLNMFLPDHQAEYIFTPAGHGKVSGRPAFMVDYRSRERGPITASRREGKEDCFSIELPGRTRGRVWVDEETFEILRLDEHLAGMYDVRLPPDRKNALMPTTMVVERLDSSIVYRRVTFTDPDETIILPATMETVTVVRNSGSPRMRTSQTFRNYRRFMTGVRIVQ
jgi:hypothetical protein